MKSTVRRPRFGGSALLLSVLSLGVLAGWALVGFSASGSAALAKAPVVNSPATIPAMPELGRLPRDAAANQIPATGSFAPMVKRAAPAVVSVSAVKVAPVAQRGPGLPFPFGQGSPFGGPSGPPSEQPRERRQQGLGSGVIISPEGYILTNHHVIDGASAVEVHFSDERELNAVVVGTDPKTDIAVLKVEATNLPVLPLGNVDAVEVGDIVLAIGNPFGIGQTVTMGIVGATGRGGLHIEDYEDFIQTDAAINPGNSGGALVNVRGELIGINTAIISRGAGGNQGVGFAVPVNLAHHVMTQLLENGRVVRGYLGVGIQDVKPPMAEAFGAPDAKGALVRSVEPGGPADQAGLERGDIIREVGGKPVEDTRQLRLEIARTPPESAVQLALWRDGEARRVAVELGELPDETPTARRPTGAQGTLLGIQVDELTPAVARQLNLDPNTQGVVVTEVRPGSAADEAGLRRGEVIQEVGRRPIKSVAEFRAAVPQAGSEPLLLLVNRGGNTRYVVVEPR